MKKFTSILTVAVLGGSLLAIASRDSLRREAPQEPTVSAMGFLIDDDTRPVGWYTFPVSDATSPEMVAETSPVSAGAMADGTYYAQTYKPGPRPWRGTRSMSPAAHSPSLPTSAKSLHFMST